MSDYQEYTVRVYDNRIEYRNKEEYLHRLDGPAVEWADGSKFWYQNGKRHRLDGPAVEWPDGSKSWYQNGESHRLDGPAIEWANGSKSWCQNGKLHRLDGPAVEYVNGTKEWYIEGVEYTEDDFNRKTKPIKELTVAEIEAKLGFPIKVVKE